VIGHPHRTRSTAQAAIARDAASHRS